MADGAGVTMPATGGPPDRSLSPWAELVVGALIVAALVWWHGTTTAISVSFAASLGMFAWAAIGYVATRRRQPPAVRARGPLVRVVMGGILLSYAGEAANQVLIDFIGWVIWGLGMLGAGLVEGRHRAGQI